MKKVLITLTVLTFFICPAIKAQVFVDDGVIQYEKSVNMYAITLAQITKTNEASMKYSLESYQKNKFKILKSSLSFSNNKTLFEPEAVPVNPYGSQYVYLVRGGVELSGGNTTPQSEQNNTIYTDVSAQTCINQKTVYDETFLVKDAPRPIKWKITGEMRNVAGYNCRRANGLMMDSIYVVAFYTDDIQVSGGPESFNGLPGMILQVALPDEHIIWTATKVEGKTIPALKAPVKGKAVNNKELQATLEINFKSRPLMKDLLKGFIL